MNVSFRWAAAVASLALAAGCGEEARSPEAARAAASVAAHAQLVADIRFGTVGAGSSLHGFVVAGAAAYFAADDGSSGHELWRTDGTGGGTALVADLRPGGPSSLPASGPLEAVPFGGGILFAADDGARGVELWFSDGTAAGTRLVKDVERGSGSSSPRRLTAVALPGGAAVFFVGDTRDGTDLWMTRGTDATTVRIRRALVPGTPLLPFPEYEASLAAVGDTLYFVAPDSGADVLWQSDGSAASPVASSAAVEPRALTPFGAELYFAASEFGGGPAKLWRLDAVTGDAAVVGNPATSPTDPDLLTPLPVDPVGQRRLYYAASQGGAIELFSTDGVTQRQLTFADVQPAAIAAAGANVFVSATQPATGRELYAWNGVGFANVLDEGPGDSTPSWLTDVGGILLFAAGPGPQALYRTDGTPEGTGAAFGTGSAEIAEIARLGSFALLAARDDANGMELRRWDPQGGTALVANLRPDAATSAPRGLAAWDGRLFFAADDGASGSEPWLWEQGVASLADDVYVGSPGSVPDEFVAVGGTLFFTAADPVSGREVRAMDLASRTTGVLDLRAGVDASVFRPSHLTRLGDAVLLAADDGAGAGRELWRIDASGAATLVKDLRPGDDSSPRDLVRIGSNVWFAADDGQVGATPFRSDGTAAGTFAADALFCDAGAFGRVTEPAWFAELDGTAIFSARTVDHGRELFRFNPADSRGPAGCTNLVADLAQGLDASLEARGSDPVAFTVHEGLGYFGARDTDGAGATTGYALWRTDGFPPPGTTKVAPVGTAGGGSISSMVSVPGVGQPPRALLFFVGNDEVHGHELWTSDGTGAGTRMVEREVLPGPLGSADGSALVPLPVRGGHVLYAADDGVTGRELWVSDGTRLGTRLLQDLWPQQPGAAPKSSNPADFAVVGNLVFFTADDGESRIDGTGYGRELWMIDATALDLTAPDPDCPATVFVEATSLAGADPSLAISAAISASDPPDPWSAGSGEVSFSYDPAPAATFEIGVTPVLGTATDASGNVAECTFAVKVQDTTGPVLTCPADRRVEATSAAGADASFVATAVDVVTGPAVPSYDPPSGSTFPIRADKRPQDTVVTVTAQDRAAPPNESSCTFTITVEDTTAPVLVCPPDVVREATSAAGAAASWGDAVATDAVTATPPVAYRLDDGSAAVRDSTFVLGLTTVHAEATDEAGNVGRCPIPILVRDTTPPAITCNPPPFDPVEATSYVGATVFFDATATDSVTAAFGAGSGPGTIAYDPAPGDAFPVGTTQVTAIATDDHGNAAQCSFVVTVADTTPPVIDCPSDVTTLAGTGSGVQPGRPFAAVEFSASATDAATPDVRFTFDPASASTFALGGPWTVTATAIDRGDNTDSCTFSVTVVDPVPPVVTCPPDGGTVEATSAAGAVVAVDVQATAQDVNSGVAALAYDPQAGTTIALGTSPITVTATDWAGNVATCAFSVVVVDGPPTITCPPDRFVEANDATQVQFPPPAATDAVTPTPDITIDQTHRSGDVFPIGTTPVTFTATDGNGGTAQCTMLVTVDQLPQGGSCGCGTGSGGSTALLGLLALVLRARTRRPRGG
jgi:ELWxxDGT repeat protein